MGGLVAFAQVHMTRKPQLAEKFLGGVLGGLVAVTAGCNVVSPLGALAIGGLAGVVHNLLFDLLERARLDDPVGAIPVHLGCGVLGTLCVAIFGDPAKLPHGRLEQLGVQALGIVACAAWAGGGALVMYLVLRRTVGLRVSAAEKASGVGLAADFVDRQHGTPSGGAAAPEDAARARRSL
jgi:Amt family ammonium transporter